MPSSPHRSGATASEFRSRRRLGGVRSAIALVLAIALAVLANLLASRLYRHGSVASHLHGSLSERTHDILRQSDGSVELIAYFDKTAPMFEAVSAVFDEYREASRGLRNLRLSFATVDPAAQAAAAAELDRRHGIPRDSLGNQLNCVIVRTATADCVIPEGDLTMIDLGRRRDGESDSPEAGVGGTTDFIGESRIASAIWNLTRSARPVVYFLTGSGEYDPADTDVQSGYSIAAHALRLDLYTVRSLDLTAEPSVPADCSLLVVAGPRAHLPVRTIEVLGNYLNGGGRLLLLASGPGDDGLDGLLRRWGVQAVRTSTGAARREVRVVSRTSPITRAVAGLPPVFGNACLLVPDPDALSAEAADRPRTEVLLAPRRPRGHLVASAENGPSTAEAPALMPPGPAPAPDADDALAVAVARSRGDVADRRFRVRLVVVGDAEFASNAMAGHAGNIPFFLACVHWLTEREALIGNPPVTYRKLESGLDAARWPLAIGLVVVAWPGVLILLGLVVRRR